MTARSTTDPSFDGKHGRVEAAGTWTERERIIRIHPRYVDDPLGIAILVHEARHAVQTHTIEALPGDEDARFDPPPYATREEVEAWIHFRKNWRDWPDDELPPTEVDANEVVQPFLDDFTVEDLHRLLEKAR